MCPPSNLPSDYSGLELDFHTLANHIPQLAWMARPDGYVFWYNQRWFEYTGTTIDMVRGSGWTSVQHPDHVDRVLQGFKRSFENGLPYEDTFPIRRHDGHWGWFLTRTQPICDDSGNVIRWFGTNTDITEQKEAEVRQRAMLREIDHRAKNALAVAQAVVKLSFGATEDDYRNAVENRIAALSRAHVMLADSAWRDIDVRQIINGELDARSGTTGEVSLAGEAVGINPASGQALTLLFNELITNAERYGALSDALGHLSIEWRRDEDQLSIAWRETGLHDVKSPKRKGFGGSILERIVRQQLRGSLQCDWLAEGVSYAITLPLPPAQACVGNDIPAG